jgi:hypothetical protein
VDGRPLAGATVDVWHSDDDGYYDVQRLDEIGGLAMRARFHTTRTDVSISGRSSRHPIRSRMTGRSATCWTRKGDIPGARHTCTS